jgi:hypothetical protein
MSERVEVGQVWADNDWRSAGRTLRVDAVDETHATCTILTNQNSHGYRDMRGRTTRIALRRFKPNSTGYRLVAPPVTVPEPEDGDEE